MILYTVYPEEYVLAGLDWGGMGPGEGRTGPVAGPGRLEAAVPGLSGPVRVVLERDEAGVYRISRLLSSDPFDYLDPHLAPGRPSRTDARESPHLL